MTNNKYTNKATQKRDADLRRRYGINLEEYEQIYKYQEGKCFVCKQPEMLKRRGKISPLCVDHQHDNGVIRHLLCHRCNLVLGYLESANGEKLLRYAQNRQLL